MIYKLEEHQGWGNLIQITKRISDNSWRISGCMNPRPKVCDEIHAIKINGEIGKLEIIAIEYCKDPVDMFFADAKLIADIKLI